MYITFDDYIEMYEPMDEPLFCRLVFDACRLMDKYTTGIDNIKKLKRFFPTDEDDVQAVKHCAANIVNILYQIHQAETVAAESRGYESTSMGIRGKVISSVTAGNESISYSTGGNAFGTVIDSAAKDKTVRQNLLSDTVREHLSGVQDANGVNLLFMGRYPSVR